MGVAVSGGPDSVCLLHVLVEFGKWPLTVLHLDHGLRGAESRGDAAFVEAMAGRFGIPFVLRNAATPVEGNVEEWARRERMEFFTGTIRSGVVDRVAVGHTRSDRAETVLFRLLRGSGTAGLAGIRPVTDAGIVRPLIEIDRTEVESYLRDRGIEWREDSTNASSRFARNRIRRDLLPQLEREWNPEIAATLARTAEWARAEEAYWDAEMDRFESERLEFDGSGVLLSASALAAMPEAVARRLVRRAIQRAKGDLRGVDFAHVENVLRLAASAAGEGAVEARGVQIRRSFDRLRFAPFEDWNETTYRTPADVPGVVALPGTDRALCLELIENRQGTDFRRSVYNERMACLDWDRVPCPLVLRNWTAGDRYQPLGSPGSTKLSTLFQLARIPSWERRRWPVLADAKSIVWTRRFGPAAALVAGPDARRILRLRETASA